MEIVADVKPTTPEVPEGETTEIPETTETPEATETSEQTDNQDGDILVKDKIQKRFDDLTGKLHEKDETISSMQKQLQDLTAKVAEPKNEWTEDRLVAVIQDKEHPEFHAWAIRELAKLDTNKQVENLKGTILAQAKMKSSYDKAVNQFPDIDNPNSPLREMAEKAYKEFGLANNPDGQFAAAEIAYARLHGTEKSTEKVLATKLAKEKAKNGLTSKVGRTAENTTSKTDKLGDAAIKEAVDTGRMSDSSMIAVLRELKAKQLKK